MSVPGAGPNDLLVHLTLAGRLLELGERPSDRRHDRVFADQAADVLRRKGVKHKVPR